MDSCEVAIILLEIDGTYIAEIMKIAFKGDFGELPEADPVGEDEEVMNEKMTNWEKACRIYADISFKKIEEAVSSDEDKAVNNHWVSYLASGENLDRLFQERFGFIPEIRQGWKLVKPREKRPEDYEMDETDWQL